MSIKPTYVDGVFKPIEHVTNKVPGKTYRVFSEEELRELTEVLQWLKAAETTSNAGITMSMPFPTYSRGLL